MANAIFIIYVQMYCYSEFGSEKMDYKSKYEPLEVFIEGKWQLLKRKNSITNNIKLRNKTSNEQSCNTIYLPTNDV